MQGSSVPERRLDILCYMQDSVLGLTPLLLIECKRGGVGPSALDQVIGYNAFVNAPFIAVAGRNEVYLGAFDPVQKKYLLKRHLPTYQELITWLKPH